jgi:hypothetical protein
MVVDAIPLWVFFAGTIALILLSVKGGFAMGKQAVRRTPEEKESPAAAVGGAVLGLVAFMLAFTFSIASGRYDARKELVRDDAEAIRTAWMRADFFPEPDRGAFRKLLREYVDVRLALVASKDVTKLPAVEAEAVAVHHRLWAFAVAHGKTDLNSDIGSLVVESVNDVADVHARRVAVAAEARIAVGIWLILYALSVLGMVAIGYQMAVAGSPWMRTSSVLAVSFALVITLIAGLDRPNTPLVPVSQKPLRDVRVLMDQSPGQPPDVRLK